MWWRRLLLVPHVVRLGRRAPRDVDDRWDRYWADVGATGDDGDVLWDASSTREVRRYVELLAAHADPARPVVDVGCGNGRYTRALAERFPRVVGVDLSAHAVARARREAAGAGGPEHRVADLTAPGAGRRLADELGPCTVFVRGVLHTLPPGARLRLAVAAAELVGPGGVALLAETNYRGPLLGYLESLGGGPRGLPRPLARAIAAGIPRPSRFGEAELADSFPPALWERLLVDGAARISTVPMRAGARTADSVPGFLALLRRR
jgi:SAM-dependent methyltransferase